MKQMPTFKTSDGTLLVGAEAKTAWASQVARCNCGYCGEAEASISGSAGDMPAEANARRLVACWNACQSIPTEALEAGVVAELVEAVRKASLWVGEFKALPAHKWAAESMLRVLEAALAKAKGGK